MAAASTSSSSSPSSSCEEDVEAMSKIQEAVCPEFATVFPKTSSSAAPAAKFDGIDMDSVSQNGACAVADRCPCPCPSVREEWSASREAPEVNVLKVTKGFQNHVAARLGTIIDGSIKEVNKNLSQIQLNEAAAGLGQECGIRIFSGSQVWACDGGSTIDSDESESTNIGETSKGKEDSETDRTKGLTESEVQLSDKDLTVRKRRKRKKRRPKEDLDYASESACELLDASDAAADDADRMEVSYANDACENKPKKRKRAKETACVYQKKSKRRKLDTDSGGDGDVSSDTDTDVPQQAAQWDGNPR